MITELNIQNVASYSQRSTCGIMDLRITDDTSDGVKTTNFIYGTNGAGKSTIVNFLRSIKKRKDEGKLDTTLSDTIKGVDEFTNCFLSFQGDFKEEILIFDEKFIADSFEKTKKVPAVFPDLIPDLRKTKLIEKYEPYLDTIDLEHFNVARRYRVCKTKMTRDFLMRCFSYTFGEIKKLPESVFKDLCLYEYILLHKRGTQNNITEDELQKLQDLYENIKTTHEYANLSKIRMTVDKNLEVINNTRDFWFRIIPFAFVYLFLCGKPFIDESIKDWDCFIDDCSDEDFESLLMLYDYSRKETIIRSINSLKWALAKTTDIIKKINTILENTGFVGFKIAEEKQDGEAKFYIQRDGVSIKNVWSSLSEGEKHFISFLYFYQLCLHKTDPNKEDDNSSKIIVIDDPITSMDASTMYQVSSIIRDLITNKTQNQYFIFTHNQYFYNEVSYGFDPDKIKTIGTWLIKKDPITRESSIFKNYKFMDDYAALWNTLKEIKKNIDTTSTNQYNIILANLFRRILETYSHFSNLGGNPWNTINKTDTIKVAFLSWINRDSHTVLPNTDLFYQAISSVSPQELFKVFRSIFASQPINDEHHYKHWMN